MPDTYTIFIIEKDFYGNGKSIYPIERVNLSLEEVNQLKAERNL